MFCVSIPFDVDLLANVHSINEQRDRFQTYMRKVIWMTARLCPGCTKLLKCDAPSTTPIECDAFDENIPNVTNSISTFVIMITRYLTIVVTI